MRGRCHFGTTINIRRRDRRSMSWANHTEDVLRPHQVREENNLETDLRRHQDMILSMYRQGMEEHLQARKTNRTSPTRRRTPIRSTRLLSRTDRKSVV